MDVRELPVDELVLDPNLNLRDRLDDEAVGRYVESWGRLPPVTVFEVDGLALLADGFHRHAAAVSLGRRTLEADVRVGTFADALDHASAANLRHGLPLTRAERRRSVEVQVRLHHEFSDRRLADELGVGRELVGKVRKQLVDAGQVPAGAGRVGADGKTYPAALAPDPNEHLPRDKTGGGQDDPRDRGRREADAAPWDDAVDPMPRVEQAPNSGAAPPWDTGSAKAQALADPVDPAAPTIDEMLALMARQVDEVVGWARAEGFADAYRSASQSARSRFRRSTLELASVADGLDLT
jgi:hypothetical protein